MPSDDRSKPALPIAVSATGLGKFYPFVNQVQLRDVVGKSLMGLPKTLLSRPKARKPSAPAQPKGHWGLRNASFEIYKGEVLGIIGRNGSGKTTLLKVLSRVLAPTEGSASIRGRVAALLAVGTGFHPMFTGRENIYMSGTLLGLSRAEIDRRMDAIIDFAEIGPHIDEPVKTYSTGMAARLGYSVAVELDADILFLDEILAVGDSGFQRKCLTRMGETRKRGKTVVLVSHNMNAIKGYCGRVILLEKGEIVKSGDPDDVVSYYLSNMFELGTKTDLLTRMDRDGSGAVRATGFWIEDALGRPVARGVSGEECTFCLQYALPRGSVEGEVQVALVVVDTSGRWITRLSTGQTGASFRGVQTNGVFRCRLPVLGLVPGEYRLGLRVSVDGLLADHIENVGRLAIDNGDFYGSGRNERHSPLLVDFRWEVAEARA